MSEPKREFLKVLAQAVSAKENSPTPQAAQAAQSFISANEAVIVLALAEANEPNAADAKQLATLDAEYRAAWAENTGFSFDDAIRAHRAHREQFRCGKCKEVPPSKDELIRQYSERRQLLKQRATIVSGKARQLAAAIYERTIAAVPKLRQRIEAQEAAIFGRNAELGRSPLLRMVDDLPRTLEARIKHLRVPGLNNRPSELLPKI